MRNKISIVFILLLISNPMYALSETAVLERIESASNKLLKTPHLLSSKYIDKKFIVDSIYKSFRPYIKITNKNLSKEEIDKRTRKYIENSYFPVLVKNYTQIYEDVIDDGNTITFCNNKTFSNLGEDSVVSISLCVDSVIEDKISVNYYSKHQEKEKMNLTGTFTFSNTESPVLIGIILGMSQKRIPIDGV